MSTSPLDQEIQLYMGYSWAANLTDIIHPTEVALQPK